MPVIGHISTGASSDRAISYGFGKNQRMKNNTEQWLVDNGVKVDFPYIGYSSNSRAVWVGGTNGIDGYHAADDMAFNQQIHNQTKKKNQVMCIVQSFSHDEADPLNPSDWEKANLLGREFAKKAYPDYQCAVFTQIDNKNHLVHNHIYVDKVNLITGHKLKEPRRLNDFYAINDEISSEQSWKVIPPKREHKLNVENKKKKPGRKAFVTHVKETVDSLMMSDEITSKADFIKALDRADITYDDKNKLNRFVSKTEKDKSGKAFVVRGKRLGTDYEKEAITNELEFRSRKQATEIREPKFEKRIERTIETERNYNQSEPQSEQDYQDAQNRKRQAEADDTKLSIFRNLLGEIEGKYREFVAFFKKYKKNNPIYNLFSDTVMKQEAMYAFNKGLTHSREATPTRQQPKKPIEERDENGLNRDQRLLIDDGNKILRENGLGELQMGYDGLTLREREVAKNHKAVKYLEFNAKQFDAIFAASDKYLAAGLPSYGFGFGGFSRKYERKLKKQKLAEKEAQAKKEAQSKEQAKKKQAQQQQAKKQQARRRASRRLQTKHPQKQQQNRKGPSM